MKIGILKKANRQRGAALILVLISLAAGSLLVVPTLDYVYTGLQETRIADRLLLEQYSADAAIEYGLWQLENNVDNITDEFSLDNPEVSTNITVNGEEVLLDIEISTSPVSDNGSFTIPPTQSGIHLAVGLDILPPVWTKSGNKAYIPHFVYVYNCGTSAVHLKSVFQRLDPRFNYVPGSYDGPEANETKQPVGDHWELTWEFDEPLPKLNADDWLVIAFTTWTIAGDAGEETYDGSGWVEYAGFQEDEKEAYDGDSGPASIGLFDLTVNIGGYTVKVNAGVTESGEIVIRSWQVE